MLFELSIFTLILTIVLTFYNFNINKNIIYLTGLLSMLSLSGILHYTFFLSDSEFAMAFYYTHFMPFLYLTGPLLYLYVSGTIKDEFSFNWKKALHFLPFIIALASIFDYYFLPWNTKLEIARSLIHSPDLLKSIKNTNVGHHFINLPGRIIVCLIYSLYTLYILIKYHKKKKTGLVLNCKIIYWLYYITITVIVCTISYTLLYLEFINHSFTSRKLMADVIYNYISGFSYSLIPIVILVFPEVLYGIPLIDRRKAEKLKSTNIFLLGKEKNKQKLSTDSSESNGMNELAILIKNYLINEKPFVDPKFSLDDLVQQLEVPKHHIYFCFNSVLKTKFTTIRSQIRVDYAKELLLNGDLEQLSMEGIWSKTGFSSRTNFFVTFKEVTGMTPLEFVQINSNK